jgi:hypothetical protein
LIGERAQRLPLLALLVSQNCEYDMIFQESPFITLYSFLLYFFVSLKELEERERERFILRFQKVSQSITFWRENCSEESPFRDTLQGSTGEKS